MVDTAHVKQVHMTISETLDGIKARHQVMFSEMWALVQLLDLCGFPHHEPNAPAILRAVAEYIEFRQQLQATEEPDTLDAVVDQIVAERELLSAPAPKRKM